MDNDTKESIAAQIDATALPEVQAALRALAGHARRFSLLIWDDETEAAVVLSNSHPSELVDMLRQTADRVGEASRQGAVELGASGVRH